jgi:hypothetical protein
MLDRLIKSKAITGMEKVPVSGIDSDADKEIEHCKGRYAIAHKPPHRTGRKPIKIEKGDVGVDVQIFNCKQAGTGAMYGTLFLCSCTFACRCMRRTACTRIVSR